MLTISGLLCLKRVTNVRDVNFNLIIYYSMLINFLCKTFMGLHLGYANNGLKYRLQLLFYGVVLMYFTYWQFSHCIRRFDQIRIHGRTASIKGWCNYSRINVQRVLSFIYFYIEYSFLQ